MKKIIILIIIAVSLFYACSDPGPSGPSQEEVMTAYTAAFSSYVPAYSEVTGTVSSGTSVDNGDGTYTYSCTYTATGSITIEMTYPETGMNTPNATMTMVMTYNDYFDTVSGITMNGSMTMAITMNATGDTISMMTMTADITMTGGDVSHLTMNVTIDMTTMNTTGTVTGDGTTVTL